MNCQDTPDLIHPFIDGELAAGPAQAVSAHLETCPDCTRLTAEVRALREAIGRSAPRHMAPAGVRGRLASALAAEAEGDEDGAEPGALDARPADVATQRPLVRAAPPP